MTSVANNDKRIWLDGGRFRTAIDNYPRAKKPCKEGVKLPLRI